MLEETELPDAEPFSLDNLSRYQVNVQLLNALIDEQPTERLYERARASGSLPYGAYGELFWQAQQEEMLELAGKVRARRGAASNHEINLQVAGIQLNGWLPQVQEDGLLRWRPAILTLPTVCPSGLNISSGAFTAAPLPAACTAAKRASGVSLRSLPKRQNWSWRAMLKATRRECAHR